jgi:hypothetical protein
MPVFALNRPEKSHDIFVPPFLVLVQLLPVLGMPNLEPKREIERQISHVTFLALLEQIPAFALASRSLATIFLN